MITSEPTFSPSFDTLVVSGRQTSGERVRFDDSVILNGSKSSRKLFPQIRGLTRQKTLANATLSSLRLRFKLCNFCGIEMLRNETRLEDPTDELPHFCAQASLSTCQNCGHWEHVELRSETYDGRAMLIDEYRVSITVSKTRVFNTETPEGSLEEIAQWFRQHPKLYNSVEPKYLESLVARIFAATGEYCDVLHVGRPDDGGVDVVLVEANDATWLVQVKRREHPSSVESVSTVRNLLGTLLVEDSIHGMVVSTADHFSFRAQSIVENVNKRGYVVRLVDRKALDRLLASRLPNAPWSEIVATINAERTSWFGTSEGEGKMTMDEFPQYNPDQLMLFED